jgi:hypothetical protein
VIDVLSDWKSDFNAIPASTDKDAAAANFAAWVDGHVTDKMGVATVFQSSGTPNQGFTFNKSVFETQLKAGVLTPDPAVGALQFATAWETAILVSTMLIAIGESIGYPPTPATQWSAVGCVISPPSVAAAKATLVAALTSAPLGTDPNDSVFPEKFRDAFLSVQWVVTGSNSVPPPTGPQPLNIPAAASN